MSGVKKTITKEAKDEYYSLRNAFNHALHKETNAEFREKYKSLDHYEVRCFFKYWLETDKDMSEAYIRATRPEEVE